MPGAQVLGADDGLNDVRSPSGGESHPTRKRLDGTSQTGSDARLRGGRLCFGTEGNAFVGLTMGSWADGKDGSSPVYRTYARKPNNYPNGVVVPSLLLGMVLRSAFVLFLFSFRGTPRKANSLSL